MRIPASPLSTLALGIGIALGASSCAPSEETALEEAPMDATVPQEMSQPVTRAVAVLHPTEGNEVHGTVHFLETREGVRVVAEVMGLSPGLHGFHIHEFGDCSAPDATSAGGHLNPTGAPHGAPSDRERHVGDLGNLSAGEDGMGELVWDDTVLALSGSQSILGRAVVVHGGEDDLVSQPSGNAGARVACGVIGIDGPGDGEPGS